LANADDLELVANDPVKSIEIDNVLRTIRFYGEEGTIVMTREDGTNEIYDLNFKPDNTSVTRNIVFDDKIVIPVPVHSPEYTEFVLDGQPHRVKIGAPTRELWIDGRWYSVYFDNLIRIPLGNGPLKSVFLEGPPPNVDIGNLIRSDLCAGTVQLLIDGDINTSVVMFLDSKPQRVDIDGKPHIFRFVEDLQTLLINGHPFRTAFGGDPMVVYVNQVKHYLRLTTLPKGVRTGQPLKLRIDTDQQDLVPTPIGTNENSQDGMPDDKGANLDRFLNVMPSPTVAKAAKEYVKHIPAYSADQDSVKESRLEEKKVVESPVDVLKLWASLVGAGLIKSGDAGSIPGLDSTTSPSTSTPKRVTTTTTKANDDIKNEEAAGKDLKANYKKPVKKLKWEPKIKAVIPVVLTSHHASLKM
jgi:hypothetical protein